MKEINKKIIVLILTLTFVFSPVLAIPAQAQWVIYDPMDSTKNYGLDALAFQLVNMIIKRISASTVNWINSGFKGSPAYVTNPEAYFGNIGNQVAGQFIFNNKDLDFLCGPISAKIKLALAANYTKSYSSERWACTLTQAGKNMENFMDSFDNGGWDNFFEISQKQQNNPIGAYMMAESQMNLQIANKQATAQTELNQGGGFMSFKECTRYGIATKRTETTGGRFELQPDGTNKYIEGTTKEVTDPPPCLEEKTNTPGSVISNKLNSVLDQSEGRLEMADEINEMISALISQLTEKLVGGASGGLRGLSNPGSTGENSFASQMLTSTSTEDYFENLPNTSVLDVPVQGQATDADCSNVDPATLDLMTQRIVNTSGIPFDQARNNLDCDPPGIH